MQTRSRQELYHGYLDFVADKIQGERHQVNRRMWNVFLWCFFLPASISITILILVKLGFLPKKVRNQLDWLVLVFPIAYSIYIVSSEVLVQVPSAFRKGGGAASLSQAAREGEWREKLVDEMKRSIPATESEWIWIIASFKIDLEAMQYRTRYLTALAGSVFFLLMQGIDSLTGTEITWVRTPSGWVDTSSNDLSQFVGLALFLVLLYLSGSQTYHSLKRYLNCAELLQKSSSRDAL